MCAGSLWLKSSHKCLPMGTAYFLIVCDILNPVISREISKLQSKSISLYSVATLLSLFAMRFPNNGNHREVGGLPVWELPKHFLVSLLHFLRVPPVFYSHLRS